MELILYWGMCLRLVDLWNPEPMRTLLDSSAHIPSTIVPTWVPLVLLCLALDREAGIIGLMRSCVGKPVGVVRHWGGPGSLRGPGVRIESADMSTLISMRSIAGRLDLI
jgi:hypothetical protein